MDKYCLSGTIYLSIPTYHTYKSHILATISSHHIASQRKHKKEYHINLETINMWSWFVWKNTFMVDVVYASKLLCTSRYPKTLFIDLYMQVYLVFCCNQMPKTVPHNRLSKYIDIYIVTLGNCQQYDKTIL